MNNPAFWAQVLNQLHLQNVGSIADMAVAGGAIRDWLIGIPHRDIDVFVVLREGQEGHELQIPANWAHNPNRQRQQYPGQEILSVHDFILDQEHINLIVLRPGVFLERYITGFDTPLNRGAFKRFSGLTVSVETLTDMENKDIFIERPDIPRQVERAQDWLQRVSQVEQGWKIVNLPQPEPEVFDDF